MSVRQRGGAGLTGHLNSSKGEWDADIKPQVKPEPLNHDGIIDLCNSDTEQTAQPSPSKPSKRPKRSAATSDSLKYEDDNDHDGQESEDDDFQGSSSSRRASKKHRSPSSTPTASSSTAKLYAIARIVTLATDGVASVSESEAKLASISSGILSRIQKSLALAKHPGTGEAEAQQALRLATRLISSQNLTQADLIASSDAETNQTHAGMSIVEIVSQTSASPRNESWVNQVAIAVNLFFDVKAYSTSYANRTKLSWTFYGLAVNTVAAAHAFEMVHNQVLTWAYQKAREKLVKGKTGRNSYCQGVAAGLIALAKEKKEEMRLAIQGEKKRLSDAERSEQEQVKKERERLSDPPVKTEAQPEPTRVKPEHSGGVGMSESRNVKLEDAVDEKDVKPFRNGLKRSASEEFDGYGRWDNGFGSNGNDFGSESDNDDLQEQFYDTDQHPNPSFPEEQDVKPHFDEALERDIIDLTADDSLDIKPFPKPDPDIKSNLKTEEVEQGAGWQSSNQLIRFRQDAEKIADDFLASQHGGLKLRKRAKTTYRKDVAAFEQGREDAKKIDVRRKRIQG
ncbi:hypothetical protein NDA16_002062 [Ustilago loliicola]|nr:hypothetical protein NDA16_002062 [Ustilago loliicola]